MRVWNYISVHGCIQRITTVFSISSWLFVYSSTATAWSCSIDIGTGCKRKLFFIVTGVYTNNKYLSSSSNIWYYHQLLLIQLCSSNICYYSYIPLVSAMIATSFQYFLLQLHSSSIYYYIIFLFTIYYVVHVAKILVYEQRLFFCISLPMPRTHS